MSIPVIGSTQNFYCDCIQKEKKESFRDRDYSTEERTFTERGQLTAAWICKARHKKSWTQSTGVFSSRQISTWLYYWECLNCGKKRNIGVWDSDGANYGDGDHL